MRGINEIDTQLVETASLLWIWMNFSISFGIRAASQQLSSASGSVMKTKAFQWILHDLFLLLMISCFIFTQILKNDDVN